MFQFLQIMFDAHIDTCEEEVKEILVMGFLISAMYDDIISDAYHSIKPFHGYLDAALEYFCWHIQTEGQPRPAVSSKAGLEGGQLAGLLVKLNIPVSKFQVDFGEESRLSKFVYFIFQDGDGETFSGGGLVLFFWINANPESTWLLRSDHHLTDPGSGLSYFHDDPQLFQAVQLLLQVRSDGYGCPTVSFSLPGTLPTSVPASTSMSTPPTPQIQFTPHLAGVNPPTHTLMATTKLRCGFSGSNSGLTTWHSPTSDCWITPFNLQCLRIAWPYCPKDL